MFYMAKLTGKTKWFDPKKGYGFITSDDGQDYFFYHKSINMEGFKTSFQGDVVEFEPSQNEKGPLAVDVTITAKAPRPARQPTTE